MKTSHVVTVTPTLRKKVRLLRPLLTLCGVIVLFLVALALIPRLTSDTTPFSIHNAGKNGARALARVLEQQGVRVVQVSSPRELVVRASAPNTTAVVIRPWQMQPDVAQAVSELPRVVYIGLESGVPSDLTGLSTDSTYTQDPTHLYAQCSLPAAVRTNRLVRENYGLKISDSEWTGCFPITSEDSLSPLYAYAERTRDQQYRALIVPSSLVLNKSVADEGNATLALNVLGATPTLVWYLADTDASMMSETDLSPQWMIPVLILMGVSLLTWGISRGQRLGRLVPENLPSYVPSIETVIGRGRLMQRSRTHAHAARALRLASARRIAARLGVDPRAPRPALEEALRAHTTHFERAVFLLWGPPPYSDSELVALARELTTLEEEISHD